MGSHHREVTITKGGLTGLVKHRRAKRKSHGRNVDDMNVITIREMLLGPTMAGDLVVRSCNSFEWTYGSGWSSGARDRVEKRLLHNDGHRKGRVLLAELECLNEPPVVVASVCLHIERNDVAITSFDITGELLTHRAKLFEAMLLAVERVACELNDGRQATILLDVTKNDARWYKDNFGFTEARKHSQRHRRVLGRRGHPPCRETKKTKPPVKLAAEGKR
jgi:hypothetical protein